MKDKHMTFVLAVVLAVVVIGGAVNYYSPDHVCPNQNPTPNPNGIPFESSINFGETTQ